MRGSLPVQLLLLQAARAAMKMMMKMPMRLSRHLLRPSDRLCAHFPAALASRSRRLCSRRLGSHRLLSCCQLPHCWSCRLPRSTAAHCCCQPPLLPPLWLPLQLQQNLCDLHLMIVMSAEASCDAEHLQHRYQLLWVSALANQLLWLERERW